MSQMKAEIQSIFIFSISSFQPESYSNNNIVGEINYPKSWPVYKSNEHTCLRSILDAQDMTHPS